MQQQRQKHRYDHHSQYRPQQHHSYAVPPQGPPPNVAHNRMPNTNAAALRPQGMNARPSHVPQQQQHQQPQQLQSQQVQQQQHAGGVPLQHNQGYPHHVSSPGHPAPMFYTPAHHGGATNFIQITPAMAPTMTPTNTALPLHIAMPQTVYQARFPYYGTHAGQSQPYYPATAGTTHPQQMYATVPFVHQQPRMSAVNMHQHSQAVASAQQQLQQTTVVAPSHGGVVTAMPAQHQPQHPHPQQPVVPQPTQPIARQDKAQERRRNILQIIDPSTGLSVISDGSTPAAPVTSTSSSESGSVKRASTNIETAQNTLPGAGDKQDSQSQVAQQTQDKQDSKPKEEPPVAVKEGGNAEVKKAVRQEFFQKITQASDDGARTSSSSSSGTTNANAENSGNSNQADAEAPAAELEAMVATGTSTPVPSTPIKDKSPSPEPSKQLVANTPVANTSSDDSKDTSLQSISPVPIENYATTPRSRDVISSPSLQPTIEKYAEEAAEEEEEVEDGAVPEEDYIEPDVSLEHPKQNNNVEETSVTESLQEETRADSALSDSVKQEESEKGDDIGTEEVGSITEEENQPNGHLPLEEGELRDDDESTVADSGNDEQEDLSSSVKGKIKYDRETLLMISTRANINEFKVADCGLPDLAKDNLNNHIKSHPMAKNSPGGQRDYGRPPRGMPNQGMKGPMHPHPNLPHLRMGGVMGQIAWGSGMVIPPAPPGRGMQPKVQLTLQREEVKLHKAENAWKPNTLKGRGQNDENLDEDAIITESIVKKTRGILNKLTPDNFDTLVQKFMGLQLEDKDERISSVISVVFEKAIDEPSFSTAYARMVQTVCKTSQETSKKFRKQILDQCQKEFSKSNTDEEEIKVLEERLAEATVEDTREQLKVELEEKKYLLRRRSLGNVRFIGELYKLQMLTPKIMVECVQLLLYTPDDENLECLCKLLTTVGQRLDLQLRSLEESAQRGDKPKFIPEPKWINKTFQKLRGLSEDKKLTSRIRFAILDVVELRENDWKPRRDTNAPKTLEEVRQDAIRQEIEEKRQINSLPPIQNSYGGSGDRDHRPGGGSGGGSRLPGAGPPQKKGSDWSTLSSSSNKTSRFQNSGKKPEPGGSNTPVFGPPQWGGVNNWGQRNQSGPSSSSQPKQPYPNLPPRLSNRFSNLSNDEGFRQQPKPMPNTSEMGNFRDQQQHSMYIPPHSSPSLIASSSPTPSNNSSAENSRPVSPSPKDMPEASTADTGESVKNIFQEYLSCKKFDDTLHWIKGRFPGNKIEEFIDELTRQVSEMSKEMEQKCAGSLVRLLIKNKETSKESVIIIMTQGVIQDLPDIMIDSPMATAYLAQFLVEIYGDDKNLDWLVQVGDALLQTEDGDSAWRQLAVNSINLLKLRTNEENVQTSFRQTDKKNVIPLDEIPWLQDKSIDTLAEHMVKVLHQNINCESLGQSFQENSWDLREETTLLALTEAICTVTWNSATNSWNDEKLKKLLPMLSLPNKKRFAVVWKHMEDYISRNSIDKKQGEGLWHIMYSMNMTAE